MINGLRADTGLITIDPDVRIAYSVVNDTGADDTYRQEHPGDIINALIGRVLVEYWWPGEWNPETAVFPSPYVDALLSGSGTLTATWREASTHAAPILNSACAQFSLALRSFELASSRDIAKAGRMTARASATVRVWETTLRGVISMTGQRPPRFTTRFTPADKQLADRQWAEWRATRRRLLQIGAFGGAGMALGLGAGGRLPVVAAAPLSQDEEPKSGGTIAMSLADQDVTTFDPPVPPTT